MANTVEIIIKGTDQASGAFNSATSGAQTLSGTLTSAGAAMRAMGTKLTAGVTVPLALVAKQALSTAGDFEAAMNVLGIAAASSGTSMKDLSDAAVQVGADTSLVGISASEAADAMTNFYKAGLDTTDIFGDLQGYLSGTTPLMGALRSAIDLAAASDLDLAAASDVVAVAMATFGIEAEGATGIADNFVAAADASVAEVSDLSAALTNVGSTMAQFGYSLEDTNTALAILSTRGIKGAEAGTNLRSMMNALLRPTEDVKAALDDMNVSLYDQDGALRPLPDIIGDLEVAFSGMTEEQRITTTQMLATSYGAKALNTLVAEGAEGWANMETAIADAASAQEVAQARTEGFNAAMENLGGTIETLIITAFTPFMNDVLTPFIEKLSEVVSAVTEADPELFNLGITIAGIAMAAGPVLIVLGAVTAALGALLSPIGLVVAAVAALGVAWATDFGGIRTTMTEVWTETIQPALSELSTWLQTNIPVALAFLQETWQTVWAALQLAFEAVWTNTLQPALTDIVTWLQINIPLALTFLQETWQTVWPTIQTVFEAVWAVIQAAFEFFTDEVLPFLLEELGVVVDWVTENWPLIQETVETVMGVINTVITAVLGVITALWETTHDTIMTVASTVWEAIQTTIDTTINIISDVITAVVGAIVTFWETNHDTIMSIASTIWDNIKVTIDTTINAILGILKTVMLLINSDWDAAWTELQGVAETVWTGITTLVENDIELIKSTIDLALSAIQIIWDTIWESIETTAETVWESIETTIDDTIDSIDTSIRDTFEDIKAFFSDLFNAPAGIIEIFTTAFSDLVTKAGEFGGAVLSAMKNAMLAVKIPMPTFSVSWESGPLGIQVPKLTLGIDWRSLGDLMGFGSTSSAIGLNSPLATGAGGAEQIGAASTQAQSLGGGLEAEDITLLRQIRDLLAQATDRGNEFAGSDLLYQLAGAQL